MFPVHPVAAMYSSLDAYTGLAGKLVAATFSESCYVKAARCIGLQVWGSMGQVSTEAKAQSRWV